MFDRGHFAPKLDHSAEGILPGERFDANQQCILKYGKESTRADTQDLSEICRDLHCQRDRYTWTSHPSLEGTKCGEGRVRIYCHQKNLKLTLIDLYNCLVVQEWYVRRSIWSERYSFTNRAK